MVCNDIFEITGLLNEICQSWGFISWHNGRPLTSKKYTERAVHLNEDTNITSPSFVLGVCDQRTTAPSNRPDSCNCGFTDWSAWSRWLRVAQHVTWDEWQLRDSTHVCFNRTINEVFCWFTSWERGSWIIDVDDWISFNWAHYTPKNTQRKANKHPIFLEVFEQAPVNVLQIVHVTPPPPPKCFPFCFLYNQALPLPTSPITITPHLDIPFLRAPLLAFWLHINRF